MSLSVYSSLPRVNFRGIKDDNPVNLTFPVESTPIRLPLFFDYAPWGEEDKARYVNNHALERLYGANVLNPKTKFYTHQSQFVKAQFTGGGKCLFLRVAPPDAKQANFRLALDIVADTLTVYERNLDGTFKLDVNGAKIATEDTVAGYRLQWRLIQIPETDGIVGFGSGVVGVGSMVSVQSGDTSDLTPIMDGLARFRGKRGSDIGFRIFRPTVTSTEPADGDLEESVGSVIYRMQIVERVNSASTAQVRRTLSGMSYVDFSLKSDAIDMINEVVYDIDSVVKPAYESQDPAAFTNFGPFERLHTYDSNIQSILAMLSAAEATVTGDPAIEPHLINFLTGVDVNGVPYHSFVVEGPTQGGLLFSEMTNHYMLGGADGELTTENYNAAVEALLDTLSTSTIPFRNFARMPYDSVWDSGFPVAIKRKFANFYGLRPDVFIHVCTQDVLQPINTPAEDSSIGITLRSHFRAMQESAEFATKALRFCVMGNAGYLINDNYRAPVPFLEYLCLKGAQYMGAENGEMDSKNRFGRGERNVIDRYRDHNVAGEKDDTARATDWANGMNFAEWFDMSRLFWSGLQSIYEDHKSPLHSYLFTQILCNVTRISHIVWRELSGDDQMDDAEFLDEVVARVTAKTTGKYDDRVSLVPTAYYDDLDNELTYSYHLDVAVQGENIRGVQNFAILAQPRRVSTEA